MTQAGGSTVNEQTKPGKLHIKPWTIVAVALVVALLGYFGITGTRLLSYGADTQALAAEANKLSRIVDKPAPDVESFEADRDTAKQKLDNIRDLYQCEELDDLTALIVNTAGDAGVNLGRVGASGGRMKSVGDISYQPHYLDISVTGSLKEVFSFLDLLHERAPTVELVQVGLKTLEDVPKASIQLLFYLSPEYVAKEDNKQ